MITTRAVRLLWQLRKTVGAHTDDAVRLMTDAWAKSWRTLSAEWLTTLGEVVDAADTAGRWPTVYELGRLERLARATARTQAALGALAVQAGNTAGAGVAEIVTATAAAEPAILAAQLPAALAADGLRSYVRKILPQALEAITVRVQQQVHQQLWPLSRDAVDAMRRRLVAGIALGDNPRAVARRMVRDVEGDFNGGLGRAMVIARTEMLDAYRDTSAYTHQANRDVIESWIWIADLGVRTCFPAGTDITTGRGNLPIEDVRVGDLVLTHTGKWQRVSELLSRVYSGALVTVETQALRVTATADHPFLVERQGQLEWVEAQHIRCGDRVLSNRESGSDDVHHDRFECSVERGCDQPDYEPSESLHVERFLGIAGGSLGMPVGLVDLDGSGAAEKEVDRPVPSLDDGFLFVGDAEGFKRSPDVPFGDGLAGMPAVAAHRAEPGGALLPGADAERLLAHHAIEHDGRAPACLGAVRVPGLRDTEDGAAAGAGAVLGVGVGAGARAVGLSIRGAGRHGEVLPAPGARFSGRVGAAALRAVDFGPGSAGQETFPAPGADAAHPGQGRAGASSAVGVFPLEGCVASPAAEFSRSLPDPSGGDLEGGFALQAGDVDSIVRTFPVMRALRGAVPEPSVTSVELGFASAAGEFHRHIVTSTSTHIQATRVYNFEVDQDHSYVASGFVVHNCPGCWAMHGTEHSVDTPGPWDHQSGRCARMPRVRPWRDLGIDIPEPDDDFLPKGPDRFAQLDHAQQLAIMGPRRLALLDAGTATLADLAVLRTPTGWRPSYAPMPVRDLEALAARRRGGG